MASSAVSAALLLGAGVEAALEEARVAREQTLRADAPTERAPLLEAERDQDRDEVHSRITSEIP